MIKATGDDAGDFRMRGGWKVGMLEVKPIGFPDELGVGYGEKVKIHG